MTFKRIVFWSHLIVGLCVGFVVFSLSLTGTLLTYERQIVAWAEDSAISAPPGQTRLSADELAQKALESGANPGAALIISKGENTAVRVSLDRRQTLLLDPYSGNALKDAGASVKAFFSQVTALHRWFALSGDSRDTARAITGAANLGFLFLLVSGLYLWWPRAWKWNIVKTKLLFRRNLPTSKARDYNWHHVFGIWALVPLLAVVVSGVVISYPWASNLVYQVYGETPPARGGPPQSGAQPTNASGTVTNPVSLQSILENAETQTSDWRTISLALPAPSAPMLDVTVDRGNGVQNNLKTTYTYSRETGEALNESGPAASTPGQRARGFLRFLHTGEIYGVVGQTLAGLGSLAALFLVYTGFALAYRRLIQPLFRRKPA